MPLLVKEGQLEFNFDGALKVDRMDQPGVRMPHRMKLVDFHVEEHTQVLLVEIKDPSDTGATPRNREQFVQDMHSGRLVTALLLKARDSYTFLHLMHRDAKPFRYVVVLGMDNVRVDPALILKLQDDLKARLRQETDQPWPRQYMQGCLVLTTQTWSTYMPYDLQRSP